MSQQVIPWLLPLLVAAGICPSPAIDDGTDAATSHTVDNLGAEGVVATLHQADLAGSTCMHSSAQHVAISTRCIAI
jgi:hypothetical protein